MSRTKSYCRAYLLAELRGFAGWADGARPDSAALPDGTVVYLWDDLTVVVDPVTPDGVPVWTTAQPDTAWGRFCREDLNFVSPEET